MMSSLRKVVSALTRHHINRYVNKDSPQYIYYYYYYYYIIVIIIILIIFIIIIIIIKTKSDRRWSNFGF